MVRTCPACGARLPADLRDAFCPLCTLHGALQIGDRKGSDTDWIRRVGDYELVNEIARGGIGIVYRARQSRLNREAAIKLLIAGHFADARSRQRLQMEASAAAGLRHPSIVEIYEVGEHEGQPFIAMEFIDGSTLNDSVRDGPLAPREAASIVLKIAEAAQFAHSHGILHRDLKPSNILVDQFGEPRVTDFGLAKQLGADSDLTLTGQVLGSPSFMAPEQADSKHGAISAAADIYSLGAILYQLITARPPFQGDSAASILRQVESAEPVAPRRLNPGVPQDLETISLRCLEKSPASRYATAGELAEDLQRFLSGHPVSARPVGLLGRAWRWSRRNPASALAVALLFLLAAGSSVAALRIARAERTARAHFSAAEEMAYVRDLALADRSIEDGENALTRELLKRHIPQEGEPDRRTFEWRLLWRLSQDQSIRVLRGHARAVTSLALFPETNRIASASWDGTVRIWDLSPEGSVAAEVLTNDCGRLWSVDISPGGSLLLAAGESGAAVWEAGPWRMKQRVNGYFGYGTARFFPGSDKAILATRHTNHIWDLASNRLQPGLTNAASPAAFSKDGTLLATRHGNTARVWNTRDLSLNREAVIPNFQSFGLRDLAISPDNRWLALGSSGGRVALLDWRAEGTPRPVELTLGGPRWPHLGWVGEIGFSPSGLSLVTAGADHQVFTWSVRRRAPILQFRGHEHEVWASTFSRDGQHLFTAGKDETIRVWSARAETNRTRFPAIREPLGPWSDHELLHVAQATDEPRRRLAVFDWRVGTNVAEISLPEFENAAGHHYQPSTRSLAFSTSAGRVKLWRLAGDEPRLLCTVETEMQGAQKLCASVDGDTFATYSASAHGSQLWNTNGSQRFEAPGSGGVIALNRQYMLSLPNWETPRLFSAKDGRKLADLKGHKDQVSEAIFLPDGKTLATAAWDGTVRFWELPSGRLLSSSRSQRQGLYALAVTPDGRTIATGGQDGVTRFWNAAWRQETIRLTQREVISKLWFTPDGLTLVAQLERGVRIVRAADIALEHLERK